MRSRWSSRKLWIAVCAIVGLAGAALAGQIETADAIQQAVWIVLAYLGVEGGADIAGAARSRADAKSKGNPLAGIVGLALIASLAVGASGCSVLKTHYAETGETGITTEYSSMLWAAPFSRIDGSDAQLTYKFGVDGALAVGQGVSGLEQSGQTEALRLLVEALIATKATSPMPIVP